MLKTCIVGKQRNSAVHTKANSAVGRESKALVMPGSPEAPTERVLSANQGKTMLTRTNATGPSKTPRGTPTEIRIQEGNNPPRVLRFPFPVEVIFRPLGRAA